MSHEADIPRPWPELREALRQQGRWQERLQAMPRGAEVGCLHVESESLHAALLPATQQATERLKAQLLGAARSACQEQLAAIKAALKGLAGQPASQVRAAWEGNVRHACLG